MPSANPKLEKQASTEAVEPIRQAITAIEHKIRNLEKRKVKLESYRDLQKNGKELNNDQKIAVAKYDEVQQTLDITRDLHKQILGYANGAVKQQKKMARKEAMERMQQDIAKIRDVLVIQDILVNMDNAAVKDDFLEGVNGAIKLSEDDLKFLDSFYSEVLLKHHRIDGQSPFLQQVQKVAEHYVAIVDGKQREVVGTTYGKLKEIITSISQCGYFDRSLDIKSIVQATTETATDSQTVDVSVQEQVTEDFACTERHIPPESMIPLANFPVQVAPIPVVSGATPVSGPIPVVPQPIPAPVETSYYTNAAGFVPPPQQQTQQSQQAPRINDVIGTPNFFFLQESELDSPDVSSQTPIVPHIPPTVNAPIPTQTYTNQNFATPSVISQPVIYQHQPPQDIAHIPGFANPNPPPPIPMPPSHQQPNMQFSPQHPAGFQPPSQQQPASQQNSQQTPSQNFEQTTLLQQDNQQSEENKIDHNQDSSGPQESDLEVSNEAVDWCQMTESGDWNQTDSVQHSVQDSPPQTQQHGNNSWGEQQRGGFRGRGARRGNSNVYNGRGRGTSYQQNGRSGSNSYYRNNETNYQNGYQQRSWGNGEGGGTYNNSFKRNNGSGQRGGRGGERNVERGGNRGQFRSQRGNNTRGNYAPRGKPQAQ